MTIEYPFSQFNTDNEAMPEVRDALRRILLDVPQDNLASELGVTPADLTPILEGGGDDTIRAWLRAPAPLVEVLRRYGILPRPTGPSTDGPTSMCIDEPIDGELEEASGADPFGSDVQNVDMERVKLAAEMVHWADSTLHLNRTELELELNRAAKHFRQPRRSLERIRDARKAEKKAAKTSGVAAPSIEDAVRYYGDFKSSIRGVFARHLQDDGEFAWDPISTTRMEIEALTRDARGENWGTFVAIWNRDGGTRKLAIPHALIAADKASEIVALLASLGAGIVMNRAARQQIVQFLATEVPDRIVSVAQIGWTPSDGNWVFVLPDVTLVPHGFAGAQPVLQTASLQTQNGLDVTGTASEWIEQIARPLSGNSNIHLTVGTAFAGPLLHWANEPPGFLHLWGASKIAKSLAAAIGQSVWGRPKVPGEGNAFGASWTATGVGLERFSVLRSDLGAIFDEIGEGDPRIIRTAIYQIVNGSTKLRGTQEMTLRPMESFRILGISTGEPSMEVFLTAGGDNIPAGLTVRLVDVPAEVRPESAFETCPVEGIEELGKTFYPRAMGLHGAVGRAWLQHLVDLGPDEIQARLRRNREEWLARPPIAAVRASATGQVRSVINRFALIASALRMAIEAGLLPWTPEDTDLGIAACMTRWAAGRKGRLDLAGEMVSAVEQIRAILAADLQGRFIHLRLNEEGELDYVSGADTAKRDTLGFVKDRRILVDATAWKTELCAGFDPKKTAQHLRAERLLISDEGKLQHQEKVLRGENVVKERFYCLDMRILEDQAGSGREEA